jgi:methyltransferase family protein
MGDEAALVALSVPTGSRVLVVGPEPSLLDQLAARDCRTWSVVADDSPAFPGRGRSEGVVVGDLDHLDVAGAFPGLQVEVVVLMGTLARVMFPGDLLRRVAKVLVPDGRVVASVPNASHVPRRLQSWQGFAHSEDGGQGRPLLRTFLGSQIDVLLAENGLSTVDTLRVRPAPVDTLPPELASLPAAVLDFLRSDADADVDHFVVIASPAAGPCVAAPSLAEALQSQLRVAEEAAKERKDALEVLEGELDALQLDLAIKDDFAIELRGQVQTAEMATARMQSELASARAGLERAEDEVRAQALELEALRRRVKRGPAALLFDLFARRRR